jgi:hypothetical protein
MGMIQAKGTIQGNVEIGRRDGRQLQTTRKGESKVIKGALYNVSTCQSWRTSSKT